MGNAMVSSMPLAIAHAPFIDPLIT